MKKAILYLWNNVFSLGGLLMCCVFFNMIGTFSANIKIATWAFMALCAMANIYRRYKYDTLGVCFILWIMIANYVADPDYEFHTWLRLSNFLLVALCVSPITRNKASNKHKQQAFCTFCLLAILFSVASFFAYFLGINVMNETFELEDENTMYNTAGVFSGLFNHSMTLAPIASIAAIMLTYKYMQRKNLLYAAMGLFCIGCVLIAASRIAFVAMLVSLIVTVYYAADDRRDFIKHSLIAFILIICTLPFWDRATQKLQNKQKSNIELGGIFASRMPKYEARIFEITKSPLTGVGFCAIDEESGDEYNKRTGVIEPGSSWLCIASMTGIIGFIIFFTIFAKRISITRKSKARSKAMILGLLTFFSIHFMAEGYIFAGGSPLCFIFWMVLGVCDKDEDVSAFTKDFDDI